MCGRRLVRRASATPATQGSESTRAATGKRGSAWRSPRRRVTATRAKAGSPPWRAIPRGLVERLAARSAASSPPPRPGRPRCPARVCRMVPRRPRTTPAPAATPRPSPCGSLARAAPPGPAGCHDSVRRHPPFKCCARAQELGKTSALNERSLDAHPYARPAIGRGPARRGRHRRRTSARAGSTGSP